MSVGLALAERMMAARFNRPDQEIVDHHTFVIASDGDIQEGVASEASSLAGHWGLGRLIVFYDDNHIQLASEVDVVMTEDVGARYEAYGWHVIDVGEDLSVETLESATREAMAVEDRPSLIIVRSHIGYGSPLQDTSKAHGSPLGEENVRETKEFYGWDPDAQFLVPDEALAHFREVCDRGREQNEDWDQRFGAYREAIRRGGHVRRHGQRRHARGLRRRTRRASRPARRWPRARRRARPCSGRPRAVPQLTGGAADLATSTNTDIEGARRRRTRSLRGAQPALRRARARHGRDRQRADHPRLPRLRQHLPDLLGLHEGSDPAGGAAGAAVDLGVHARLDRPRRGRARPTSRSSSSRGCGPCRGSRSSARRTPTRPRSAGASRYGRPTRPPRSRCRARTCRCSIPQVVPDDAIERGAYVLREGSNGGEPDLILIATGSEVSLAMEAADSLEDGGVATRVVSMPCMDTFAEAGRGLPRRGAAAGAAGRGWPSRRRARSAGIAGSAATGAFVGMTTFGESGPYKDVYEHFGITPEKIAEAGRAATERVGAAQG